MILKAAVGRIRQAPSHDTDGVRALGVDDWAKKKGHSYGTILVDLEKHRVVDLLPDRTAQTLAKWLKGHPSIEVVSRDRYQPYIDGISKGAPKPAGCRPLPLDEFILPPTPVPSVAPAPATAGSYIVQPGATLSGIAERFGTTVEALVETNGIPNPNLIFAGQELQLPPPAVDP